jgi:hypothetical protein
MEGRKEGAAVRARDDGRKEVVMMMAMMSRGECGERVGLIAWWLLRPS